MKSKLVISCAGFMPWFDLKKYSNPSIARKLINCVWDYKNLSYNNPIGKSGYFFLNGLKKLKSTHPEIYKNIEVNWWGNIDSRYMQVLKEMGISEIFKISGFVSKQESLERLNKSDVLLLTLALGSNNNKPFSLPGKMFDYLKLGKPVLGIMDESSCSEVLMKAGIGIICDPLKPEEISESIAYLYRRRENLSEIYCPNTEYINANFEYLKKGDDLIKVLQQYE